MKHVTIAGLAERREQRIRERKHAKAAKMRESGLGKNVKREIRGARVFFATLPHPELLAAYRAVKKAIEQKKNEHA